MEPQARLSHLPRTGIEPADQAAPEDQARQAGPAGGADGPEQRVVD